MTWLSIFETQLEKETNLNICGASKATTDKSKSINK